MLRTPCARESIPARVARRLVRDGNPVQQAPWPPTRAASRIGVAHEPGRSTRHFSRLPPAPLADRALLVQRAALDLPPLWDGRRAPGRPGVHGLPPPWPVAVPNLARGQ